MSVVNIKGLDKAEVLLALYNHSHYQGFSFLGAVSSYTLEDARKDIKDNPSCYFDYLHGRVLKVDISGDEFSSMLYNRDCGENTAEEAISELINSKK